jgi:hypothetical protein
MIHVSIPSLDDSAELLYELGELRSITAAEAGMGAMSLGYGVDGAYAAAAAATFPVDGEERAAIAITELATAAYWFRPRPATPVTSDDIPF